MSTTSFPSAVQRLGHGLRDAVTSLTFFACVILFAVAVTGGVLLASSPLVATAHVEKPVVPSDDGDTGSP